MPGYRNCKIVLGGDGDTGKTTIAQKLAGTLDLSKDRKMTPGIDFHHLEVSKENLIHAQVWDLGGQEQFRAFQYAFFESAHVIILVYSVKRFPSFLNIESWIPLINKENLIMSYLIANKIDAEFRSVEKEEGEELALKNDMKYFEISALNGDGFSEFKHHLIKSIKKAFGLTDEEKQYLDLDYCNGKTMDISCINKLKDKNTLD